MRKKSILTQFEDKSLYIYYNQNNGDKFASFLHDEDEEIKFDEDNKVFFNERNKWKLDGTVEQGNQILKPLKMTAPVYYFAWVGTYPNATVIE